jgi:hypothetical protein
MVGGCHATVELASRYRTSTAEYVVSVRETPVSRSRLRSRRGEARLALGRANRGNQTALAPLSHPNPRSDLDYLQREFAPSSTPRPFAKVQRHLPFWSLLAEGRHDEL